MFVKHIYINRIRLPDVLLKTNGIESVAISPGKVEKSSALVASGLYTSIWSKGGRHRWNIADECEYHYY